MGSQSRRDFLFESHGEKLRVRIDRGGGDGVPLLICSGFGISLELLDSLADSLAPAAVIRFDAPGIGGSHYRLFPYRFSLLANIVDALLESLKCPQVDVLGISWGGMLAQEMALTHPQRYRKLILASTLSGMISVPGSLILKMLTSPAKWLRSRKYSRVASLVYGGRVRKRDWKKLERHLALYLADVPGYLGQVSAVMGWTSIHRLHKLSQPVLLLYGIDDSVIPMINAKLFEKILPDARLVTLDCGHLFPWTCAERMCKEISRFRSER